MKVSFVATVYNEEKTIIKFIESIFLQERKPDEVIIVDGGSLDRTVAIVKEYFETNNTNFKILIKKSNRSVGRNEGIKKSKNEIIAISDAGCVLDKKWLSNIIHPFIDKKTDVVAGYYRGKAKSVFQKCLIPYTLVMPDRINEQKFLPASRSMAFRKKIWKKLGGFSEKFSHNEDYFFAKKMEEKKIKIIFARNAIVEWIPRNNIKESFVMFLRFAYGDAESSILRLKVLLIFYRYFIFLYLFALSFIIKSNSLNIFLILSVFLYIFWSVYKNYKYVNKTEAFIFLPLLQFTSDVAVVMGSLAGFLSNLKLSIFKRLIIQNFGLILVVAIYSLIILLVLSWGIPGNDHPFTYFMDEWHQSQSVRNLFKFGTPNISGSANGSIFHFFLVGIYLLPFQILGIIDITAIKSSISELTIQNNLFQMLRLNTFLFGILSIVLFTYISKRYFKFNYFFAAFLFSINPVWVAMSTNFKYDIALMFWILISYLFLLRYVKNSNHSNFLLASFFSSLALSVKFSAIPLFIILIFVFFIFDNDKKIKNFSSGIAIFIISFMLVGIPDVLFGKGNVNEYLTSVILQTPNVTSYNYYLGMHFWEYLFKVIFPMTFGFSLYYLFLATTVIGAVPLLKFIMNDFMFSLKTNNIFRGVNKELLVTAICFMFFAVSLYPLKIESRANRVMVLLPFMVILSLWGFRKIYQYSNIRLNKQLQVCIIIILLFIQFFQTFAWLSVKLGTDPRVESSKWISQNIQQGTAIGIENIPIYQLLPDIVVKEFYFSQYNVNMPNNYVYNIINSRTSSFPEVIVLSNDELESKSFINSDKKLLVEVLRQRKYKLVKRFRADFNYFKYLGNELDFYVGGLVFTPNTISIYSKIK